MAIRSWLNGGRDAERVAVAWIDLATRDEPGDRLAAWRVEEVLVDLDERDAVVLRGAMVENPFSR